MRTSSAVDRGVERLSNWIESLSPTLRPAALGALFIVLFMAARGAWIVVPLVIVAVLLFSPAPLATLAGGFAVVGLAIAGGALGGLAYGLLGRHLQRAFPGAHYLTGILATAPYMFVLPFIDRVKDNKPFLASLSHEEFAIVAAMSILVGLFIGHTLFGPDRPSA